MFGGHVGFVGIRRQVTEFGVKAGAVVEADDVVGQVARGLGMVGIVVGPDALHFEIQEEALHDRVIPTVALAAHAGDQLVLGEQGTVSVTGVLAAAVRMHEQSGRRLPLAVRFPRNFVFQG